MKQRCLAEAPVTRVESAQRIEKASPDDAVGAERENTGRERAPLMAIVVHRDQAPEREHGVIESRRPRDIAAGIAQEVLLDQRAAVFVQDRVSLAEEYEVTGAALVAGPIELDLIGGNRRIEVGARDGVAARQRAEGESRISPSSRVVTATTS